MKIGRLAAVVALGVSLVLGVAAPPAAAEQCATWYREGHDPDKDGNSHDHSSPELDQDHGVAYLHDHTGHYVLRGEGWYVEVVGGGYYDGQGVGPMNQGGYVQAGVTPGGVAPVPVDGDVNGHFNFFASGKSGACVDALGNKVGDQGQDPQH